MGVGGCDGSKLGEALVGATCLRPKVDCSSLLTALTGMQWTWWGRIIPFFLIIIPINMPT